jgi:hypothetical protein
MEAMAKDKRDDTTPRWPTASERRASLKKIGEGVAAMDEELADLERALILEGVKSGAILPSWAEKLLKPAHVPKSEPKPANTRKPKTVKTDTARFRPQEVLILAVARDVLKWPDGPDGNPKPTANLSKPEIVKQIGDAYKKRHKGELGRNTILRAFGLVKR